LVQLSALFAELDLVLLRALLHRFGAQIMLQAIGSIAPKGPNAMHPAAVGRALLWTCLLGSKDSHHAVRYRLTLAVQCTVHLGLTGRPQPPMRSRLLITLPPRSVAAKRVSTLQPGKPALSFFPSEALYKPGTVTVSTATREQLHCDLALSDLILAVHCSDIVKR
jgi:hypothetical protein